MMRERALEICRIDGVRTLDWGLLTDSVGPRLRLLRNQLSASSIAASASFGLPTGSLTVLSLISANPGSSQAQLAEQAGITDPGLVGILDNLEQKGLVERQRSATDRRRNNLVLTELGTGTIRELFAAVDKIEAPIREALGEKDMALFIEFVDRAVAKMDEG